MQEFTENERNLFDEAVARTDPAERQAFLLDGRGDFGTAERLARQSVALHRKIEGDHHPETAWSLNTLYRRTW